MSGIFKDAGGGNWIFVSHSNNDLESVRGIRNFFEARGHNPILFYLRCLTNDDLLPELLEREIGARNFFVLCDSENSRASRWVQQEIEMVKAHPDKVYEEVDLRQSLEQQLHKLEALSKRATVFLSYSQLDNDIAAQIGTALTNADFRVLKAEMHRTEGVWLPRLAEQIEDAIHNGFVLLLVTQNFAKSPWVQIEYFEAFDRAVQAQDPIGLGRIVPVLLDHSDLPKFPFARRLRVCEFESKSFQASMVKLITELKYRKLE
jgi:hypothetical protein